MKGKLGNLDARLCRRCLAGLSPCAIGSSFRPLWRPLFIFWSIQTNSENCWPGSQYWFNDVDRATVTVCVAWTSSGLAPQQRIIFPRNWGRPPRPVRGCPRICVLSGALVTGTARLPPNILEAGCRQFGVLLGFELCWGAAERRYPIM